MNHKNSTGLKQTRCLLELCHWVEVYLLSTPWIALAKHTRSFKDICFPHGTTELRGCQGLQGSPTCQAFYETYNQAGKS